MTSFFVKLSTWGTATPHIIDDEAMYQAERGINYLNPDDYDYLCDADTMHEAEEYYAEALSDMYFTQIAEAGHP
jgi:hypothetical protein